MTPRSVVLASTAPIPLSGALVLITFGLIAAALCMTTLATAFRSARSAPTRRAHLSTAPIGGPAMSSTRRWRLIAGAGLLAGAAIVGVIGWLKISDEPLLNRQVPFFASTGIAVVILAVAGGAMLVAEQMRTDDRRLDDIEDAVRTLAEAIAPSLEKPARLREPEPEPVVAAAPTETVVVVAVEPSVGPAAAPAPKPPAMKAAPAKKAPAKKAPAKKAPAKKAPARATKS